MGWWRRDFLWRRGWGNGGDGGRFGWGEGFAGVKAFGPRGDFVKGVIELGDRIGEDAEFFGIEIALGFDFDDSELVDEHPC